MSGSCRSRGIFDLPGKRSEIEALEKRALDPGFWSDHKRAQSHMKSLDTLKDDVTMWERLLQRSDELVEFIDLAEIESEDSMIGQLVIDAEELKSDISVATQWRA